MISGFSMGSSSSMGLGSELLIGVLVLEGLVLEAVEEADSEGAESVGGVVDVSDEADDRVRSAGGGSGGDVCEDGSESVRSEIGRSSTGLGVKCSVVDWWEWPSWVASMDKAATAKSSCSFSSTGRTVGTS